jgi:mRNA-degrading endonuclease toxin of MazEF toxin-antitoxin module
MEKAGSHLIAIPRNEITMEDGNPAIDRVALTDQIRTLDKTRLRRKAGFVSVRAINSIKLGLDYLFGNVPLPRISN